ncbi:MAG: helix-turn-helix transcriptional regulator [Heliobacteriaceae bacterium]|nr:helix-turn-helix transcriptional regulator [Heliobacteriaceae bacterium]
MPRGKCCNRGNRPCSCEMGNLYRFTEPIVLACLARLGISHGYQIAQAAESLAVTHAGLDVPAVYRVLRRLENNGYVQSTWDTSRSGPARREYVVTSAGLEHLDEWTVVLGDYLASLNGVLAECRQVLQGRLCPEETENR